MQEDLFLSLFVSSKPLFDDAPFGPTSFAALVCKVLFYF